MNRERITKTVASLLILITLSVFTSYANSTRDSHLDRLTTETPTEFIDIEESRPEAEIS